jgi:hypothetical protein
MDLNTFIPYKTVMECRFTPEQRDDELNAMVTTSNLQILRLKIGTVVMCANIDLDQQICNGSQGIVTGFSEDAGNSCRSSSSTTGFLKDRQAESPEQRLPVLRGLADPAYRVALPYTNVSDDGHSGD